MRTAYALLGLLFIALFIGGAYALRLSSSKLPATSPTLNATTSNHAFAMQLTSTAFKDGGSIPPQYTCDESQSNPPLAIAGVPAEAKSLALIMEDRDVPKVIMPSGVYDHWILFNMPTTTTQIAEGGTVGVQGSNTSGKLGYVGPCPPAQYEPSEHRYIFTLYALDEELPLKEGASREALEVAMQGHVLEQTELMGRYKRR